MFKKNLILLSALFVSTIAQGATLEAFESPADDSILPSFSELCLRRDLYKTEIQYRIPKAVASSQGTILLHSDKPAALITFFVKDEAYFRPLTRRDYQSLLDSENLFLQRQAKNIRTALQQISKTIADLPA